VRKEKENNATVGCKGKKKSDKNGKEMSQTVDFNRGRGIAKKVSPIKSEEMKKQVRTSDQKKNKLKNWGFKRGRKDYLILLIKGGKNHLKEGSEIRALEEGEINLILD